MTKTTSALLNYETMGNKGPQVLLIHGLFGDLDNLKSLARDLEDDYQLVLVDVRNHGDSFHNEHMNYSAMAEDIEALREELAIEQWAIVGHSMGGKLAMEYALTYQDHVAALIVADVAPVAYDARHHHILDALASLDLSKVNKRQDADQQLAQYIETRGVRQFLLKNLQRDDDGYHWRLNLDTLASCYEEISGAVREGEFAGPVLFIKGADSDYLTEAHRDAVTSRFADVDIKIIEGTGHWLHAEKPRIFNRLVRSFLEQHCRTA